jgi:hypothetical protein
LYASFFADLIEIAILCATIMLQLSFEL